MTPGVLRAPLLKEVSERYLVPVTTLHNWRASQDQIESGRKGERRNRSGVKSCRWPELESNLYHKYRKRRDDVRREPISKSCEITQAYNLNCRRRLSRKAQ